MWIYVLVGLGVGVMALMFVTIARQRRYRILFSDVHLEQLVQSLGAARTAPATTLAGVTLEWRPLKVHSALVLRTKDKLAPEAVRFLMGALLNAMGREATAALIVSANGYALVVPGPIPSVIGDASSDIAAWRTAGVEAMRGLAVVPGHLAAYE